MTQSRSRRSSVKIVLIVLAVVVVLCCCGGGAGAYFFFDDRTKAAREATSAFLSDLESGDLAAAYERLCDDTRARYEQSSFEAAVNRRKPVSHDLHWGGWYGNDNGLETARITADVTYSTGPKEAHAVPLRKEAGAWKVCGNPY
ncbi:hypothetical protein OHA72_02015 [Dactylosporangium sp. NBC_01737]|uniref:Rv0361 family membrane protein n=1 Tax=Dactylosporangium sp. NBC_01737 TaxID=2975959 RepID=UPI002E0F8CCF|nr:hypothetical protein OHA72_02015 [Dactylosporangium sp. NBC_01737]